LPRICILGGDKARKRILRPVAKALDRFSAK
jgi:hypothetical protein